MKEAIPRRADDDIVVQDRSDLGIIVHQEIDDADLSAAEFRVYMHLVRRAAIAGRAWPGIDSIARVCLLGARTVIRALDTLEKRQMLVIQRQPGMRNMYLLTKRSAWSGLGNCSQVASRLPTDRWLFGTSANEPTDQCQIANVSKQRSKQDISLSRPKSETDVIRFTTSLGLPESDGHYFWSHWEGNGFTNNRKAMKNWQATIRSWKLAGHCPSQRSTNKHGNRNQQNHPGNNRTYRSEGQSQRVPTL